MTKFCSGQSRLCVAFEVLFSLNEQKLGTVVGRNNAEAFKLKRRLPGIQMKEYVLTDD